MKFLKFAIPLTASLLFLGCTSQSPKTQPSPIPSANLPTPSNTSLKEAVNELVVLEDKVKGGVDDQAYSIIITNALPLVQNARGDAKAVAAMKSAFQGHQLALQFWQCDRVQGYDKLRQCRSQALLDIFAKYPDIKAQAEAAVKNQDLLTLSVKLDRDEILKKIWEKAWADTTVARQVISPDPTQKQHQP